MDAKQLHIVCMKHKTGAPISKLRSLTDEGGKPMSQISFAKFIGMPSGTLARVEAGAVPLPREAAERIEASCGVDADRLYEGRLVALDGSPYTAQSWQRLQRMALTPEEIGSVFDDIASRVFLLLESLGPHRAIYGGTRMRQLLESTLKESGVTAAEMEMAARRHADVETLTMTVGALIKHEDTSKDVVAKLKKFPAAKRCKVTLERYTTWPVSRSQGAFLLAAKTSRTIWRVVLPNGSKEGWVVTHHKARGREWSKTDDKAPMTMWGITPNINAVTRAAFLPDASPRPTNA